MNNRTSRVQSTIHKRLFRGGAVVLIIGLTILTGCQTAELAYVRFTPNARGLVGSLDYDSCLLHHIPSGKTSEFKGTIECEDFSGTRWIIRPVEPRQPWIAVQLRSDGSTISRNLPPVPGVENPCGHLTIDVAFAFGSGEDEIDAGVGPHKASLDQVSFYVLKAGQAEWECALPSPMHQAEIVERLGCWPVDRIRQSGTGLRVGSYMSGEFGLWNEGCGDDEETVRQIVELSRGDDEVREVCRLVAPGGRAYATVTAKQWRQTRFSPPCIGHWTYSELKLSVTDVASGKTQTVVERGLGPILMETVVLPVLDLIFFPVSVLTYVDA